MELQGVYHVRSITDKDGNKFLVQMNDPRYSEKPHVPSEWYNQKQDIDPSTQYTLAYYGKWIIDTFDFGDDIITEYDKICIKNMLSKAQSKAASTTSHPFNKYDACDAALDMISDLKKSTYTKRLLSSNLREIIQMIKQPFITYPQSLEKNQFDVINKYQAICDTLMHMENDKKTE